MLIRHETLAEAVVDTDTSEVTEVAKQVGNKFVPNPTGKGGFLDNPTNINRKGRPKKGMTLTDLAKEVLEEELPSGVLRKEALVKKVAQLAYEGSENMIKLLWNYVDGMPTQKQEITGKDGKDLPVPIMGVVTNVISGNNSDQKNSELTKTD
jgi:hypothetical protein